MFTLRTAIHRAPLMRRSLAPSPSTQPHLVALRSLATTSRCASKGEGMGKKESVGEPNPVSARAHGVKKAAKSVAEGATGVAQKATGDEQSNLGTDEKIPGPDTRDALQAEEDKGKKHGLAHKGEQQGAI